MFSFSNHFSRAAVISLPFRGSRRARLRAHLKALNMADDLEWVEACNGAAMPLPQGWGAGAGAWGCLQSHLKVLRSAREQNLESILIMEDDVVFHPRAAEAIPAFLASVPAHWGQVYLGGQHLRPARPTASPLVVKPSNVNRSHAYAVSRAALPRVISWLEQLPDFLRSNWHVDHQFGAAHERRRWPVFAPSWWLAGQETCQSDVSGSILRRRWWHSRRWAGQLPLVLVPEGAAVPGGSESNLHFGPENPAARAKLAGNDCELLCALHLCAQEALDFGCLPALRAADAPPLSRLSRLWPAGIRPWLPDSGGELAAYPFNGLFPHPFNSILPAKSSTNNN
jgi:hypothetical protein